MPPVKKVVILGPECTGKSELSAFLAAHFRTAWVPEFARTYLDTINRPYEQQDLLHIANGQLALEDAQEAKASRVLFCDTDLYVIKVWSLFKYGSCHPEILNMINTRRYDHYLLTYVDIPWEYDPQREHPDQREDLFNIYLEEMKSQPVPFSIIRGSREQRRKKAVDVVYKLMEG